MDWTAISAISALVQSVVVVASPWYVIVQLRQSTEAMSASSTAATPQHRPDCGSATGCRRPCRLTAVPYQLAVPLSATRRYKRWAYRHDGMNERIRMCLVLCVFNI